MSWKNRPLPQLITRAMSGLGSINTWLLFWFLIDNDNNSTFSSLRENLIKYLLLLLMALFLLLVTVVEKPNKVLTAFVLICDALFLFAIIASLFIQGNFAIQFFCGLMPVFMIVIVLSYPTTARYMMDKYGETVRAADQKNSAQSA